MRRRDFLKAVAVVPAIAAVPVAMPARVRFKWHDHREYGCALVTGKEIRLCPYVFMPKPDSGGICKTPVWLQAFDSSFKDKDVERLASGEYWYQPKKEQSIQSWRMLESGFAATMPANLTLLGVLGRGMPVFNYDSVLTPLKEWERILGKTLNELHLYVTHHIKHTRLIGCYPWDFTTL